jgi:hypothetical protein
MSSKQTENREYKPVNLFRNPITTISTILVILYENLINFLIFLISHKLIMFVLIAYLVMNVVSGAYSDHITSLNKIFYFALYWIVLGIASSIGLGTGLHTFVLYLGPHIAKVTLAANECKHFPVMYPNRWEFKDFLPCTDPVVNDADSASFWVILLNVQIEAFLWGVGTAIGELPPYFMAKAAAEGGKTNEEIEELRELEQNNSTSLMDKIKTFLYQHLKKHGFITVLLCASVGIFFNIRYPTHSSTLLVSHVGTSLFHSRPSSGRHL